MADNKARDDKFFNCSDEHEFDYVSGLYGDNAGKVREFLKAKCADNTIHYSTHVQVRQLIKDELGLEKSN